MLFKQIKIVFALTGSFSSFQKTIFQIEKIVEQGAEVIPVMSFNSYNINTKFGTAKSFIDKIEAITGKKVISTIEEAEPIGPKILADIMVIAPCSGNTIGKIANGIADTPVLIAARSYLRNETPLIIGIATSDGLLRKC